MEKTKFREIVLSPVFLIAAQIVFSALIAVGAIFYVYDTVIEHSSWKIVLLCIDFVTSCGALFALAFLQKKPDATALQVYPPLIVGAIVFATFFSLVQKIGVHFLNETVVRILGVAVVLSFYLACIVAQVFFRTRRQRGYFLWATAVVALGVYALSLFFSCAILPKGKIFKAFSEDSVIFDSVSAEELELTESDRAASRAWFEKNLEKAGGEGSPFAFDFSYGKKKFSETISEWEIAPAVRREAGGEVSVERVFTHAETGLEARLFASYYDSTATLEWKVVLTNRGGENSPVLSDLYALSSSLSISDPTLYFSGGSAEATDDFALYRREMSGKRKTNYVFDSIKGRTSMLYLPFFNLSSASGGATIGVGWSGEWTAHFAAKKGSTFITVGQSALEGYLEPEESVRTPLVSLSFYSGSPLKGFNTFRADIKRGLGDRYQSSAFLLFAGAEGQDDTSRANEAGTRAYIEKLETLGVLDVLDYAWYDAAWYDLKGAESWRDAVGNWSVDKKKYPNGLGAVSEYLGEKGAKMLLWYEPERVPKSSDLYKEIAAMNKADTWLLYAESENCLFNMGNAEAREHIKNAIVRSLKENGVAYYRQDFNIDPKKYWEKADQTLYGGRTGFAENKYVVGEYAFLDALREEIPDLLIDNCASGGRRIDLEMCRRSIPLWRSDYACHTDITDLSEAIQYETYGLGFWLPYSSTTDPAAANEYELRSLIGACVNCYADIVFDHPEQYAAFIRDYQKIKNYFAENYYPLTSCTMRASFVAMQFGTEERGVIVLFDRAGKGRSHSVCPNGLSAGATYKLSFIEGGEIASESGERLMKSGFSVRAGKKKAGFVLYEKQA